MKNKKALRVSLDNPLEIPKYFFHVFVFKANYITKINRGIRCIIELYDDVKIMPKQN